MLKSIRSAVVIIAFANLVGLVGFVGWLAASGRLNTARVQEIRSMLAITVAQEAADEEAAIAGDEAAIEVTPQPTDLLSASMQIEDQNEGLEQRRASLDRREDELDDLMRSIERGRRTLDQIRAEIDAREAAERAHRDEIARVEGAAQFRTALETLESIKPEPAKNMLQALIDDGKMVEVVAYLNAMQTRGRAKILTVFEQEDPVLASDLLERLRTRGTPPRDDGDAPDGQSDDSASTQRADSGF